MLPILCFKHLTVDFVLQNIAFGVNIIENSNLADSTNGWFPLGNCTLSVKTGSPHIIPPMARDSLGPHELLSGRYILVTNRMQTWMGPAQTITDKVKLFVTYQVSAWVRIGSAGSSGPQNVNVALGVDNQWVNGGQNQVSDRHTRFRYLKIQTDKVTSSFPLYLILLVLENSFRNIWNVPKLLCT